MSKITLGSDNFTATIQPDAIAPAPITTNLVSLGFKRQSLVNDINIFDSNYVADRKIKTDRLAILDQEISDLKAAGALEAAPVADMVQADPVT